MVTVLTFLFITYKWTEKARVFGPGKPFQPGLMFASKAGAYSSGTLYRRSPLG